MQDDEKHWRANAFDLMSHRSCTIFGGRQLKKLYAARRKSLVNNAFAAPPNKEMFDITPDDVDELFAGADMDNLVLCLVEDLQAKGQSFAGIDPLINAVGAAKAPLSREICELLMYLNDPKRCWLLSPKLDSNVDEDLGMGHSQQRAGIERLLGLRGTSFIRIAVVERKQRIAGDKIWVAFIPSIRRVDPRAIGFLLARQLLDQVVSPVMCLTF